MALTQKDDLTYDQVAETIVEAANRMLDADESADIWEVASGVMAGAVQFWLYSRQPCKDPFCQACAAISTPERRLEALLRETKILAEDSDYYTSIHDVTSGSA